jgi:hypothetical protein
MKLEESILKITNILLWFERPRPQIRHYYELHLLLVNTLD